MHQHSTGLLLCIALTSNLCNLSAACRKGTRTECDKAPLVPGYNMAGEGFDVIRMQRKGAYVINVKTHMADNCTVCENRFQGGQLQKLPTAIVDWRLFSRCDKHLSSALHHSVDSVIKSSSSLINNNWRMDLGLDYFGKAVVEGSHSDVARFAHAQNAMGKATFALHEISCKFYSCRVSDHPQLSAEFTKHLTLLPRLYNKKTKPLYRQTINTYGTHYIRHVHLGGLVRQVTAFRTCLATLEGIMESEIKNCLNVELKMALGFIPANASLSNKCSRLLKDNMSVGFLQGFLTNRMEILGGERYLPDLLIHQSPGEAYANWIKSLYENPAVVAYSIFPLHHLVSDPELKASLRSAVIEYIEDNTPPSHQRQECKPKPNQDLNCCPLRAGRGTLRVTVQRATGLNADYFTQTDGHVKVWYNTMYVESRVVTDDDNPVWNEAHDLGSIEFGHELILEVWDSDVWFDDLVGRCVVRPESGTHSHSCKLGTGVFYFSYITQCDPHLTGPRCGQYSP